MVDANCLATLTAVLAAIGLPVGIMFRALIRSYTDQIADLQERLDRALTAGEKSVQTNSDLTEVVKGRRR